MLRAKFYYSTGETNHHGTQRKGESWNQQTVKGWKLRFIDIRKANNWSKEVSRSVLYWRLILYRPSGACHYFDFVLAPSLQKKQSPIYG